MDKAVVLLVDKQMMFRIGVSQALSSYPEFQLLATTPDQNTLTFVEALLPDVLLLDVDYPSLSGMALARKITLSCPAPG